jgi:hypothetical protein
MFTTAAAAAVMLVTVERPEPVVMVVVAVVAIIRLRGLHMAPEQTEVLTQVAVVVALPALPLQVRLAVVLVE